MKDADFRRERCRRSRRLGFDSLESKRLLSGTADLAVIDVTGPRSDSETRGWTGVDGNLYVLQHGMSFDSTSVLSQSDRTTPGIKRVADLMRPG